MNLIINFRYLRAAGTVALGVIAGALIFAPSADAQISDERLAHCRAETGPPVSNGEIIYQAEEGGHVITVDNGNDDDALLKLKKPDGSTILAFIVKAQSQASIETIPDGEFYIYFASGKNYSRAPGCGFFTENLYVEKFPDLETFYMEEDDEYE